MTKTLFGYVTSGNFQNKDTGIVTYFYLLHHFLYDEPGDQV